MIILPEGFIPLAHKSGWMTAEFFLVSLKHLQKQINCSSQYPILLIMDNHVSHISYPIVKFAKQNGIVLFTLPPHTSHQDLKKEHHDWIMTHPGARISIYVVPGLNVTPYMKRFNCRNIKSSFAACGIYPFYRNNSGR
uniref:DDE-1 domain-containing protein n=1 Tax=Daphnia galeata TaxID=27404 RepID=A0A8J2RJK0_9CRUS|nr:unnamed protein product [Daphnia galeata]